MRSEARNAWVQGHSHVETKRVIPRKCELETLCESFGLSLDDIDALAVCSEIVEWVRQNYKRRYCPESLLARLGLYVSDEEFLAPPATCQEGAAA